MIFIPIADAAAVPEGRCVGFLANGQAIAVARKSGALHAFSNRCPHAGSRLDGGRVGEDWIACPLHGARFDLATGACRSPQLGCAPLLVFPIREAGGWIEIALPGSDGGA